MISGQEISSIVAPGECPDASFLRARIQRVAFNAQTVPHLEKAYILAASELRYVLTDHLRHCPMCLQARRRTLQGTTRPADRVAA